MRLRSRLVVVAALAAGMGCGGAVLAAPSPAGARPVGNALVASSSRLTVEAWSYPGQPGQATCRAAADLATLGAKGPSIVKPQYLQLSDAGQVTVVSAEAMSCNGYGPSAMRDLGRGRQVVATLDGAPPGVGTLLSSPEREQAAEKSIESFVQRAGLAGVELDLQPDSWSSTTWSAYMSFVAALTEHLRPSGRLVQVDMNAWTTTPPDAERYLDPVLAGARLVVMAFDHQYVKACSPIAPYAWLRQVVAYVRSQVTLDQVSFGLPAYGYRARSCSSPSAVHDNIPYLTMIGAAGFPADPGSVAAQRDPASGEVRWKVGTVQYDYVDAVAMRRKLSLLRRLGVSDVSVWALGGNPWFSGNPS